MTTLIFNAADVRRIVEHALAAPRHQDHLVGYTDDFQPITEPGQPALVLVHDDGVYLMSNGLPRDLVSGTEDNGRSFVAYAKGCHPQNDAGWWDASRALVGGDDFAETLPWAREVLALIERGAPRIELEFTDDGIGLVEPRPIRSRQ